MNEDSESLFVLRILFLALWSLCPLWLMVFGCGFAALCALWQIFLFYEFIKFA